jgi:5-methylthioribose kinase
VTVFAKPSTKLIIAEERYSNLLYELTVENAAEYLTRRGLSEPRGVTALGGGVSNTVLLVETADRRLVLKQALNKLRVEQDWFSDRSRVFRESAAIAKLAPHVPPGSLPEVLFEDSDNFIFAMTAAPPGTETWKTLLLRGDINPQIAVRIGELLVAILRATWRNPRWQNEFGDQTVFDQLRLDPYYRSTARAHPDLARWFEGLIRESSARRLALVHGDWSPKNFLIDGDSIMAIDFEVAHFGDPAFDVAFLLNHLALKSFFHPHSKPAYLTCATRFLNTVRAGLPESSEWLEPAVLSHLAGLMLARVDGKSPAEYLNDDLRVTVRQTARKLIVHPPAGVEEVFDTI